jgi:hypothetical protein
MDAVEPLGAALEHVKQEPLEEEGPLESELELGPTSIKEEPQTYCLELVPVLKAEPEAAERADDGEGEPNKQSEDVAVS